MRYEQAAQEGTRLDHLHEIGHMSERVKRLEEAIREAVKLAPAAMQRVIRGLQALRGIVELSAVTIATELGQVSRFGSARQLMGYSGAVPAKPPAVNGSNVAASPRPATHTCGAWPSKRPGAISSDRP